MPLALFAFHVKEKVMLLMVQTHKLKQQRTPREKKIQNQQISLFDPTELKANALFHAIFVGMYVCDHSAEKHGIFRALKQVYIYGKPVIKIIRQLRQSHRTKMNGYENCLFFLCLCFFLFRLFRHWLFVVFFFQK